MSSSKKDRAPRTAGDWIGAIRGGSERLVSTVRERVQAWIPASGQPDRDFLSARVARIRDGVKERVRTLVRGIEGGVTALLRPIPARLSREIVARLDLPTRDELRGIDDHLRTLERKVEEMSRDKAA